MVPLLKEKRILNVILDKIRRCYEVFCQIIFLLLAVLVVVCVFMRYLFGVTFVWTEELITMLFIATTFFGAVIGMKYKEHITIGFFYDSVTGKGKKVLDIINAIIILALQIMITYLSVNWIGKVGNVLTSGLRIPIGIFYVMMPFSAVLIGLYCIFNVISIIYNWNDSELKGVN